MEERMMQEINGILPALEQGLSSLDKLGASCLLPAESPYSRARLLLASAMEKFSLDEMGHLLPRISSQDNRRALSLLRRLESHQQARLSPYRLPGENDLRHGILLSMMAMELSAVLAQYLKEGSLRQALHFLLPEFLDETYRLANFLLFKEDDTAQDMLAGYSEIMPGRPLIACHRHPHDEICHPLSTDDPLENITPLLLGAALGVKKDFSLQAACRADDDLLRALFLEISLIAEGQQTRILSLLPQRTPYAALYLIQFTEMYLYDSLSKDEENQGLRQLYLSEKELEKAHLKKVIRMMENEGEAPPFFSSDPDRLRLGPNKGYIRDVLQNVGITARREEYVPVGALPEGADFFRYQQRVCTHPQEIASHLCIARVLEKFGMDYRFEIAPHPIELFRNRSCDHQEIGR